jgi:hypothetical protein
MDRPAPDASGIGGIVPRCCARKQLVTVDDGGERRLMSELLRTVCGHGTSSFWRRKKAPGGIRQVLITQGVTLARQGGLLAGPSCCSLLSAAGSYTAPSGNDLLANESLVLSADGPSCRFRSKK